MEYFITFLRKYYLYFIFLIFVWIWILIKIYLFNDFFQVIEFQKYELDNLSIFVISLLLFALIFGSIIFLLKYFFWINEKFVNLLVLLFTLPLIKIFSDILPNLVFFINNAYFIIYNIIEFFSYIFPILIISVIFCFFISYFKVENKK